MNGNRGSPIFLKYSGLKAKIKANKVNYFIKTGYKFGLSFLIEFFEDDKETMIYVLKLLLKRFKIYTRNLASVIRLIFARFRYSRLAKLDVLHFDYKNMNVSIEDDSYFKCIIGYYRSKYRRIRIISDMSFINASCVCGGCN